MHMQEVMTLRYQRCPWGNRAGLVMVKPSMHRFNFSFDQLDTWCDKWKSACSITSTTYLEVEIVNVGGINLIVCIKKFFFFFMNICIKKLPKIQLGTPLWHYIIDLDHKFFTKMTPFNGRTTSWMDSRLYHIHNFFSFLKVCT